MAILVSFSPKPSAFTQCNTSTGSLPAIICSSKRKKKNAAKQKVLSPAKTATKLKPPQHEDDMLLGIGAGASSLQVLQPRLEEDESATLPLGPQVLRTLNPLSRLTLGEATSSAFPVNSKIAHELSEDQEEYEWVEVNIEDENRNSKASGEDKYIFWEGGSQSMSEEDEVKLLAKAQRELTRLQAENPNSKSQSLQYEYIFEEEDVDDTYRDVPDQGNASMYVDKISEDDDLLSEAEAELALFEESCRKVKNSNKFLGVDFPLQDISEQEHETEEDAEDESSEAQPRQKSAKRAIPAVMRSFDRAKIYVKAGNGGNGVVAFRREKYVPFGGPSGGSGGRGGHIYIEADPSMNSLLSFRKSVHFRAGRGSHGQGKSQDGATGEDCVVKVPLGTVIREASDDPLEPGNVLIELMRPYQRELLLPGGRGGRGNAAFKTGRNKTPQLAEYGEEGADMWIELELKLVADVGIIGVPNAGKSTLLSVISAAQPAIGAYPFTTLLPNLGVVPIGFEASMVVADLPGLLEGAHLGIGLGHEFLRHTERCRVLVHVVDGMSQQPEQEYEAVRLELELFNPALCEKPYIVAFNKMDIPEAADRWPGFQAYMENKGIDAVCISAATKMGTEQVIRQAYSLLQTLPAPSYEDIRDDESENMAIGEIVRRQRNAPIEEFEIICEKHSGIWRVEGAGLERFTQMTNWEYFEAMRRFQQVLNMIGVNKALREKGVSEGDTVVVGEMEFIWHDSEDLASTEWKRGFRGSRLWPH